MFFRVCNRRENRSGRVREFVRKSFLRVQIRAPAYTSRKRHVILAASCIVRRDPGKRAVLTGSNIVRDRATPLSRLLLSILQRMRAERICFTRGPP